MKFQVKSYNGTLLNDGTNYRTKMPIDALIMAGAQVVEVERADNDPFFSGKKFTSRSIPLKIEMVSVPYTKIDSLITLFDPQDTSLHDLIVVDLDTAAEWVIQATTNGQPLKWKYNVLDVILYAQGATWKKTTQSTTTTWTVTATGQTKTVTPGGTLKAFPRFSITPQAVKTGGYLYKRWVPIYNTRTNEFKRYPLDLTNGGLNTAALVADNSNKCQINNVAGITNSATTIAYDTVTGTVPSSGMGYIDTEQISWTGKTGTTSGNLTGCTRGINGTTAATHADNAVIYMSKMQADGDDWRAIVDGVEVNRWLADMNGASSKLWTVVDLSPKIEATVSGTISNSGAVATISVKVTAANKTALQNLAKAANKVVIIDSEAFSFTAVNVTASPYQITGCTRAQKGTSMASHSDGATIRWIEHDIWQVYGNSSLNAPETNDNEKPMFNLSTSTNTSWDYDEFWDATPRAGMWTPNVIKNVGGECKIHTADQNTDATPATEMGMGVLAYFLSNAWRSGTGNLEWTLFHPAGVTTVTASGEKYMVKASWATFAGLQKSANGTTWANVWNEAKPTAAATWQALASHSSVTLSGTYSYVRFYVSGSVSALLDNALFVEYSDVTLTLASGNVPNVTPGSEQNNYYLDFKLTNNTTGEFMQVTGPCAVLDTLVIDCDARTIAFSNGTPAQAMKVGDTWLTLNAGSNTLQWDETGVTDVDIDITWYDRRRL